MTAADASAFAAVGEWVVAVGSLDDLRSRFPGSEVIDFGDAVLTPGFYDSHIHLAVASEDLLNVDLSPGAVRSLSDARAVLTEAAETTPHGQWIRASRYDDGKVSGGAITRFELDEISREHPILVLHIAGHWGVANSRALELGGITEVSEAPPGGELGRDASGRLNGVLYERALFEFAYPSVSSGEPIVPPNSFEDRLTGLQRAVQMFHAAGLTSINDALVGPDDLVLFQEAERRGVLTLRVNMLLSVDHYDAMARLGLRSGFGGTRLRVNGVKGFVDGAIGGRTCLLEQPFEGRDDHGMQTTSTADLAEIVERVHCDGSRLGIHANGDRAIALLLDRYEAAAAAFPRDDVRHRIEHCSVVTEEIVGRMHRLGAIAVPFANYVSFHGGNLVAWYGKERVERMFAHRWFLDRGVAVAGSSDYPCGPFEPLYAMQGCVTRLGDDGAEVGLSQRIAPREALGLYTTGSAYASHEEAIKGKIAPGHLADFVVLGEDPLTVPAERIGSVPVLATYVGARRVWGGELALTH